jgi:hypothetical protein
MTLWGLIADGWQDVAAMMLVIAAAVYLFRRLRPGAANSDPSPCSRCSGCPQERIWE